MGPSSQTVSSEIFVQCPWYTPWIMCGRAAMGCYRSGFSGNDDILQARNDSS